MATQSSLHYYLNWAKERVDEMDAALASLESKVSEVHANARVTADQLLADIRRKRDDFRSAVKRLAAASEPAWIKAKTQLESDWSGFEVDVKRYVESFGKQVEQQQATFKVQADAQMKAWHEAADSLRSAANEFAAVRRGEVEATVKRMEADAATAQEKLHKLNRAGTQSWSVLMGALAQNACCLRSRQPGGAGSLQEGSLIACAITIYRVMGALAAIQAQ